MPSPARLAGYLENSCEAPGRRRIGIRALTGAMPPFGNLFGMDVYVEDSLTRGQEIAFNAGSDTELVRMSYDGYAGLVTPKVISF